MPLRSFRSNTWPILHHHHQQQCFSQCYQPSTTRYQPLPVRLLLRVHWIEKTSAISWASFSSYNSLDNKTSFITYQVASATTRTAAAVPATYGVATFTTYATTPSTTPTSSPPLNNTGVYPTACIATTRAVKTKRSHLQHLTEQNIGKCFLVRSKLPSLTYMETRHHRQTRSNTAPARWCPHRGYHRIHGC